MKLLFVCTGNTCRSPMAEALARKLLPAELQVQSAGIHAFAGDRVSKNAILALREKGIDISSHRAAKLTPEMLAAADRVLTMTVSQANHLKQLYPEYGEKINSLGVWVGSGKEIIDPIGGSLELYRACAQELEQMILTLSKQLSGREESQ